MSRTVIYTGDIFRLQRRGGITRYFLEVMRRLARPFEVAAGLHQSAVLDTAAVPARAAIRLGAFVGSRRLRELPNRLLDRALVGGRRGVIVHPTYYRDPRGLPSGEPVVATVFDMAHERLPGFFARRWWSSPDPARAKAALCARADAIVCISQSTRNDLAELIPAAVAKARVIPCGAPSWEGVAAEPIPGVRAPFLLWVGERRGYKNFDRALEAWARAAHGTMLVCVGGGALDADERARIARLGREHRVLQVACPDGQLRWAYQNASCLLYLSLYEGFGIPLAEAMTLGCPLVASDIAVFREVAGEVAIYVDPSDVESIAAGLEQVLAVGRTAERSRSLADQVARFSWDDCAAAHEALYRELE